MSIDARLAELKLELPPAPPRGGVYQPVVITGNLAYISGHGPYQSDGSYMTGVLGDDLGVEEGQAAAKQTGLALLATMKAELGSLDRIKRVVKMLGMVNATPEFGQHPAVINGCSELFRDVFGEEAGVGARSAVGMGSLPGNIAVEIEVIFEIE
jgi:enamine deaminase RidA (YjgF/YER057c/UK114 family)